MTTKIKNVSFMQVVLGSTGALLIWAGIKDINIVEFFHQLVVNPSQAFNQGHSYAKKKPTSTTPNTPGSGDSGNSGDKPIPI